VALLSGRAICVSFHLKASGQTPVRILPRIQL
jgi:hypothetical protein